MVDSFEELLQTCFESGRVEILVLDSQIVRTPPSIDPKKAVDPRVEVLSGKVTEALHLILVCSFVNFDIIDTIVPRRREVSVGVAPLDEGSDHIGCLRQVDDAFGLLLSQHDSALELARPIVCSISTFMSTVQAASKKSDRLQTIALCTSNCSPSLHMSLRSDMKLRSGDLKISD